MRSTMLTFGLLFATATAAAAQDKMGSASKGEKSSSTGSTSSTSSSAPATIDKGSSYSGSSSSSGSISNWKSPSSSTGYRAPSVRETFGDVRSKSEYTRPSMGSDLFAGGKERAWQEQRKELRDNLELKSFIQRLRMEVAHNKAKEMAMSPAPNKASATKAAVSGRATDVDPPALPPSPNKSGRFDPTKVTIPVNNNPGNNNYDAYLYDLYLRNFLFNNSFYGYCSPMDLYWMGMSSRYGYGSRSLMDDWWFAARYMNMGFWGGYDNWRPFYGYGSAYGYGRGYGRGGYGYGGFGSPGCSSMMNFYGPAGMYGIGMDGDNHNDRCAVVTVDTYGNAKYQLRLSPASLKAKSAEELEKKLNQQLEKNETIFLVDDEGYELQLTPGTARKFSVEHCQER